MPRAERVVRGERNGPVEAVGANVVEISTVAIPGSGQEDGAVSITRLVTCHSVTVNTIQCSPSPCAVIEQFGEFCLSGHAPTTTPLNMGHVILRVKSGLGVSETVIAITAVIAVFGQGVI